jgi:hypothetical protein
MLFALATSSCNYRDSSEASSDSGMGSIVGVNYTENGVQEFTVDGVWGANIDAYSGGGGHVCCLEAAGKDLNKFEKRALATNAISSGNFPVMRDSDLQDLHDMSEWSSSVAVSAITDTRRESGGHVRRRRVFDKS